VKMVSFYHRETGLFHPMNLTVSDESVIALNTPPDHLVIDGVHDRLSQRVDLVTGAVVDYQPPAPGADHEWDEITKRWKLNAAVVAREAAHFSAMARIIALEARQHRAVRELALGHDGAKQRLQAIDDEISALRSALSTPGE